MSKKYKCTVVETYTKTIEIPDDVDIADIDISEVYDFSCPDDSEETIIPISGYVDLVYKDECFEISVQERFSKSLEDKPKPKPNTVAKGTKLEDLF